MNQELTYKGRVALGMSGGVDSSVAAALLLREGYEVMGVTCLFGNDEASEAAVRDAKAVADLLGVPHMTFDARDMFAERVIKEFSEGYACGLTPSPCVGCNARVKIPALLAAAEEAVERGGRPCDFVATGHYARVVRRRGRLAAACAADAAKDQSYMLAMLSQEQLSRLLLPLGDIVGGKPEVRRIAGELGLPTASKSDSQDICFIPDGDYLAFLEEHGVKGEPGDIVSRDGRVLGRHEGLFRYTIGQRKGLGIGGAPEPYYVVGKDAFKNRLIVGFADEALISKAYVSDMNWQSASPRNLVEMFTRQGPLPCSVKLRYRHRASACKLVPSGMQGDVGLSFVNSRGLQFKTVDFEGSVPAAVALLDEPQATTAPGQFAVFYEGDAVLGAGVIRSVG